MDKHDKAKDVKASVKAFAKIQVFESQLVADENTVDAAPVVKKPAMLYREYPN